MEYSSFGNELIREALGKIVRRLGFDVYQFCLRALDERDYAKIADLTLYYYDKAYLNQNSKRTSKIIDIELDRDDPLTNARLLAKIR